MRIIFVGMGGVRELGEGWRGVRCRGIAVIAAIGVRSGVVERCGGAVCGASGRYNQKEAP